MCFCRSWFSNMVSFRYVLVVLNFLHDIFSIKFYTISFLWDLFTISFRIFLLMRNITWWILDTEVKAFHEIISYFMKYSWNYISWNVLKEKFHSVFFHLASLFNKVTGLQLFCGYCKIFKNSFFHIKHLWWLLLKKT